MNSNSASVAVEAPPTLARLRWRERQLVKQLGRLRRGRLEVRFSDGTVFHHEGAEDGPAASITVQRPAALLRRLFWRGDLGFAEAYMAGDWHSGDLAGLLELLALNLDAYAADDARHPLMQALFGMQHWMNRNTRRGSRRNIAAHYDLGNDFYAQWLDPGMTYSAALFDGASSLQQAQDNKYARILQSLDAKPGQHILEIGCGWGGFAEYAARQGMRVTGVTLSQQQLDYARQRIADAGLSERVDLRLCDYRDLQQSADHIVSIEMFEAVGREYWEDYFATIAGCLRPGGRAALQVITIDESGFERYAANPGGFIQRYIFPGGVLPTRRHLPQLAGGVGLKTAGMSGFGVDYADTLAHWHGAFDRATAWLEAHGYDQRFRRMWRYYLAFCEAGFRAGEIDVVQCVLHKP